MDPLDTPADGISAPDFLLNSGRTHGRVNAADAAPREAVAIYVLRYFCSAHRPLESLLCDDFSEVLQGYLRWPRNSLEVLRAVLKFGQHPEPLADSDDAEDDNDGDDPESIELAKPAHPIDALLCQYSGGYGSALKQLHKRRSTWLMAVLRRSLAALGNNRQLCLHPKIASLQNIFGWSDADLDIAALAWHMALHEDLHDWADNLPATSRDAAPVYARLIDRDILSVRRSFASGGALERSGMVLFRRRVGRGFADPPQLNAHLFMALEQPDFSAQDLASKLLPACAAPQLLEADFAHAAAELQALRRLLSNAMGSGLKGINILIYGPPGTGKTQLARWLVQACGLRGFEIPPTQQPGEGNEGLGSLSAMGSGSLSRLALLRSAQRLLGQAQASVLIFDECEDAFPKPEFGVGNTGCHQDGRKAWINEVLEACPTPIIWIGNAAQHIDPAFLRRFTYHLEWRRPPRSVRLRIAQARAERLGLPAAVGLPLADCAQASPAMIDMALRYAWLAGPDVAAASASTPHADLALRALHAGLAVQGKRIAPPGRRASTRYDPAYINIRQEIALHELLGCLASGEPASLCLYGAPGTGKTSFAEHLAERLDRPLLLRRASDLRSKWVGESERNICAMFEEAQAEGALLLLDEADSFLSDRAGAEYAWQQNETNELLQAMERFDGVFVAATNRLQQLDKAALRRFGLKLEFLPLTLAQRLDLFINQFADQTPGLDAEQLERELLRLDGLTLGDFAVVMRQIRLGVRRSTQATLLAALADEMAARSECQGRPIGFTT